MENGRVPHDVLRWQIATSAANKHENRRADNHSHETVHRLPFPDRTTGEYLIFIYWRPIVRRVSSSLRSLAKSKIQLINQLTIMFNNTAKIRAKIHAWDPTDKAGVYETG
jgi:hypothetical protein